MSEDLEKIVEVVRASKKYGIVCDETVMRIAAEEAGRQKSEKAAVKAVKTRLHQITGAFISPDKLKTAGRLLDEMGEENREEIIRQVLGLHTSSAERMGFAREMFEDIFAVTGRDGVILDIACGLNPLFMGLMDGVEQLEYHGVDINVGAVALVNRFFEMSEVCGRAIAGDVLYQVPEVAADHVFLFKILPLLEQQRKGSSRALVEGLKAKWFTISFPTKTLSGKNVGMHQFYRAFMGAQFGDGAFEVCLEKEYENELVYVIKRWSGIPPVTYPIASDVG